MRNINRLWNLISEKSIQLKDWFEEMIIRYKIIKNPWKMMFYVTIISGFLIFVSSIFEVFGSPLISGILRFIAAFPFLFSTLVFFKHTVEVRSESAIGGVFSLFLFIVSATLSMSYFVFLFGQALGITFWTFLSIVGYFLIVHPIDIEHGMY